MQVLRLPLFMLPQLISQLVNAQVAIQRLEEFLVAEEQEALPEKPAAGPGTAVSTFEPPVLGLRWCWVMQAWYLQYSGRNRPMQDIKYPLEPSDHLVWQRSRRPCPNCLLLGKEPTRKLAAAITLCAD